MFVPTFYMPDVTHAGRRMAACPLGMCNTPTHYTCAMLILRYTRIRTPIMGWHRRHIGSLIVNRVSRCRMLCHPMLPVMLSMMSSIRCHHMSSIMSSTMPSIIASIMSLQCHQSCHHMPWTMSSIMPPSMSSIMSSIMPQTCHQSCHH